MKKTNLKKYSQALLEVGRENEIIDDLIADLETVSEKFNLNTDIKVFLNDPHLSLAKKVDSLEKIFQDFISKKTYNFLKLLIKDKAINYLEQILNDTKKMRLQLESVKEVVIESTDVLEVKDQKQIEQIVGQKTNMKVLVKNIINKNLIGGIKITIDTDTVFDGSVLGKINNLKQKINSLK